ncbi:glycoside hydrolase family 20 protein [Coniophora puteana RWD-64-598 SS2]|uniref:Beta-hexosaminidase n=1 Tax=Coniophora puteana (strain RWD-64-598) TaxID=741705 RepID=A0A5M3MQK6_CONPW|nr:glycoside hydrolase family 20 protein [Coniophora puteana RWD-64-598 SS2]EIW81488.1 glycoside hydrolase family 20 protein [Coniophora puteana RWD-64-598 SS2]
MARTSPFGLLVLFVGLALSNGVLALWPIPRNLTTGSTALKLSPAFTIQVDVPNAPSDLYDAVGQAKQYLENDKLGRLVVGRGANDTTAVQGAKTISTLTLSLEEGATVNSITDEARAKFEDRSEEYQLTIPDDGSAATLVANSTLGLYRGLTTFGQIWYTYGADTYTLEAPFDITDSPAYPYRGLGLDTSRNYFPVQSILRTLDAMSWVKINTFHWHITDSQSWPLEVAEYPELAQYGAYSAQDVYTEQDIQQILSYAGARGIDVLLEIDTPGHTAIIGTAYPEYVACMTESPWSTYANEPPAGQLRFPLPEVRNFTTNLLASIAKTMPSYYFSTGGDELNLPCYTDDPITSGYLNSTGTTINDALDEFTNSTHSALIGLGKTPVVWEEMVLDFNLTSLSDETIVMTWISSADAAAIADKGFRIVQAPSNYFYLDCGAGEWIGDDPAGNSWCDPFKTWQYAYTYDPLANLTTAQQSLVLGGEQILWTEQSGPENLEPIVWPRAAASAEIFWSAAQPGGAPLNGTEALPRLQDVRYRMVQRGLNPIQLQPQWCALRPYECDLYA